MTLLAMLLALAAEYLGHAHRDEAVARARLWDAAQKIVPSTVFWHSAAMPLLLAFLPAALVAGLRLGVAQTPYLTPVQLAFDALVLFLCLGPRDLADDVRALRRARAGNDHAATARLRRELSAGPSPDADSSSLLGTLFIQSHERLFGVLWWFLALGPAGALLYRIARRLPCHIEEPESPAGRTAAWLHAVLAFVPTRLTAVLFGLAGSLDDALRTARDRLAAVDGDWKRRTWLLLAETATAALDWEDAAPGSGPAVSASLDAILGEVQRLQQRALLILLAVAALFTAGVWVA